MATMFDRNGHRVIDSGQRLADAAKDSVLDFFKSDEKAAEAAAKRATDRLIDRAKAAASAENVATLRARAAAAASGMETAAASSGRLAKVADYLIVKPVQAGVKLISVPVTLLVLKPANMLLSGGAAFFTKFRRGAPLLALGAVVAGTAGWLSRKNGAALQNQFDASQQALEAQAAMPQGPYTNSVTSQDMANLNAALAAKAPAGHAANVEAEQAVPAVAAR